MKKDTKNYLNLLKVIAMIFVVCMHVISKAMPNYPYTSNTFHILLFIDILLRTSVPLFIMISGNLLLNKDYTIKQIICKLIKYYVLFILFNSFYKAVDYITIKHIAINFNIAKDILFESITFNSIYQMWYFKILLITYAMVPFLRWLIKKESRLIDSITLALLLIIFFLLPSIIPVFYQGLNYYLCFITYFFLGYYIKKYEFKYETLLLIIPFIISYYLIYTKSVVLDHDYTYFSFDLYTMLFLVMFIFKLFSSLDKYFKNDKLNNLFKRLASYSFYIFIFHGLVIGLLSKLNIINIYEYNNMWMIIPNTLIVYTITLVLSVILKYINEILIKLCKKISE